MRLPLSVLDLCPVASDGSPSRSIHQSVDLAKQAEALGYVRFWIAEHHNMPSIATSSPEVMIAHVAGMTSHIRVGAGGVMLPNHTPLKVVEQFRTLEALFPDRIDLGIGRAPGTDPVTSAALRRDRVHVNEQLVELCTFATGDFPGEHPFAGITAMPSDVSLPPLWMLGSTTEGAEIGAALGVGYAFAGHFAMKHAAAAMHAYRSGFVRKSQPRKERGVVAPDNSRREEPYAILALSVVCGEDDEHAERLAKPGRIAFIRAATGKPRIVLPTLEEAASMSISPAEAAAAADMLAGAIVGGPATVRAAVERLVAELEPQEVMIASMIPDHAERVASYRRIAELGITRS